MFNYLLKKNFGIIYLVQTKIKKKKKQRKNNTSHHLIGMIGTFWCAYEGERNGSFSENCVYVLNK